MNTYRYLIDFDMNEIDTAYYDVIIVGSGIAGMYTSLEIDSEYKIAILTKEGLDINNTTLAQGGIAVSLDKKDSPQLHFNDTIFAGAGLCDEEAVWVLVNEAKDNIEKIRDYGVKFDQQDSEHLALGREAAHSMKRIIHAGDTTGKVVWDQLAAVVSTKENINIFERNFVMDLLVEDNCCKGIIALDETEGKYKVYLSNVVVCASGGYGQLYSYTTNPEVATGDGCALAYRAGASLTNLEFIQFHPTVLFHPENKSFLLSEAMRGEGAILRNSKGERFMPKYHEMNELAPRDVVSRSIFKEMKLTGCDHVYLDITFKDKEYIEARFPNIYKTCLSYGIDITKDYIPVAPAEHYCMGGIKTDIYGRTGITGFYACGESACNGLHGANRLASNSLLEGLVFGQRIVSEVRELLPDESSRRVEFSVKYKTNRVRKNIDKNAVYNHIKNIMNEHVGIIRDKHGLTTALAEIRQYKEQLSDMKNETMLDLELKNMITLSELVIEAALEREESRGAHYRTDFPNTDDRNWRHNIIKSRQKTEGEKS
ncbi:MAG: L-aspartate oxidase [Eubacteriales bacterium]|nr:L-aspartate oxidase [Eubacteriales bacterium]